MYKNKIILAAITYCKKKLTVKQLTKKEKSRIASFPPSLSFAKSRGRRSI